MRAAGVGRAGFGQRGFSLFIVVIMLLVSGLLAIGGARVAQLLESMVGNERDHQRAFEAAEAALLDAEHDIRQKVFDTATKTYVHCSAVMDAPCRTPERNRVFPDRDTGWVTAYVLTESNSCTDGICYFAAPESGMAARDSEAYRFWTKKNYAGKYAKYGQFTAAPTAGSSALSSARYWIEVIDRPNSKFPLYRITAMAAGARAASAAGGTEVMLQISLDPDPVKTLN
jgi:type IV pilus assembly protein PilX